MKEKTMELLTKSEALIKMISSITPQIQVEVIENQGIENFEIEDAEDYFHCEGGIEISAPSYYPSYSKCPKEALLIDVWIAPQYYLGEEEKTFTDEEMQALCLEIHGKVEVI